MSGQTSNKNPLKLVTNGKFEKLREKPAHRVDAYMYERSL